MLKYDKNKIKKILLIKNDKIGDLVISSGFFKEIRKNFPRAKITALVSDVNKPLLEKSDYVDRFITLDYRISNIKQLFKFLKMGRWIRKEKFDLGVDLRGSMINIFFLLFLGRVKKRIATYNRKSSKIFLSNGLKKERISGEHSIHLRLRLLKNVLNINSKDCWPSIVTDKSDRTELNKVKKIHNLHKYITVVPEASYPEKQWPFEKWQDFIDKVSLAYPKHKIVVTGGDLNKLNFFKPNKKVVVLKLPLRQAYLLFKDSDIVVTQDGGPMHLAWAGKAKLLAIMANFLPIEYLKPLGKNSSIIITKIEELEVKEMLEYLHKLLKR